MITGSHVSWCKPQLEAVCSNACLSSGATNGRLLPMSRSNGRLLPMSPSNGRVLPISPPELKVFSGQQCLFEQWNDGKLVQDAG